MISSFVKKGRRSTAHLCLFTSFWSASRTRCTFLGVTDVRVTSSATGISTALSTALLELQLTVLVRVACVGSAEVSTVGAAEVSSVGTAGAGKCTERLVFESVYVNRQQVMKRRNTPRQTD